MTATPSRVLITGAAGFIGANLLKSLSTTTDHEITVLDALTYAGGLDTIQDELDKNQVTFVHGDIADRALVTATMPGHDVVIHLAAESHVDRSIVGPDDFVRTNCLGTNVLCDVARQVGVDRFLHVSTDEVYGSRVEGSFVEDDLLRPSSPYSASKAGSDLIALGYYTTFGLPVVVTRAANNYGPYQFPEKVIPLFVTNLIRGLKVPVYGDGSNVRDWLFVSDHCAAIETVLANGVPGTVYNVGGGCEISNLDLTHRLIELCEVDASLIDFVPDRLGHDFRYSISGDRVEAAGWAPAVDIDEGLEATVRWYKDNEWWWKPRLT